jgi:hypothetical protein
VECQTEVYIEYVDGRVDRHPVADRDINDPHLRGRDVYRFWFENVLACPFADGGGSNFIPMNRSPQYYIGRLMNQAEVEAECSTAELEETLRKLKRCHSRQVIKTGRGWEFHLLNERVLPVMHAILFSDTEAATDRMGREDQ